VRRREHAKSKGRKLRFDDWSGRRPKGNAKLRSNSGPRKKDVVENYCAKLMGGVQPSAFAVS
jgi:hypothetical protein